jgi:hypothetical protein
LYAAFEYSIDQSFIRLAQYISSKGVAQKHIQTPIFSVGLDDEFKALADLKSLEKGLRKRIEAMTLARDTSPVSIRDSVLSQGLQSAASSMIALAFDAYGISEPYLFNPTAKGYIDEVVERRHAVAHGRESPITVGVRKVAELRVRYDSLYNQSIYVIEVINKFCIEKKYVLPYHRRFYS